MCIVLVRFVSFRGPRRVPLYRDGFSSLQNADSESGDPCLSFELSVQVLILERTEMTPKLCVNSSAVPVSCVFRQRAKLLHQSRQKWPGLGRVFDNLSIVLLLPFRYYLNTATLSMESREAAEVALCVLCCPCLHWVLAGFPPCIFLCVPFHFGTHSSTDAANRAAFVQCIVKREVSTFKQSGWSLSGTGSENEATCLFLYVVRCILRWRNGRFQASEEDRVFAQPAQT